MTDRRMNVAGITMEEREEYAHARPHTHAQPHAKWECLLRAALCLVLVLAAGRSFAAEEPAPDRPVMILVVGAAGAEEYGAAFGQWADRWQEAAARAGVDCTRLGNDEAKEPDHGRLRAAIEGVRRDGDSPLWLVLIGHGTFDGRTAKFNLRGPDLAAADLAGWLESVSRPTIVIDCAAASAPFLNALSRANRVVLTATKSGHEQNYARFGDHLSKAIVDPAADLDRDGQTSLLEAFLKAARGTAEFYEQDGRLSTETALLDDNGDGRGTPAAWYRGTRVVRSAADGAAADGLRAHQIHLLPSQEEQHLSAEMRARRDELERSIAELWAKKKGELGEDEYYAQLEPLLVELARLYATPAEP